ncbi:MAG: NfeD family protein [Planctomycetota bacterium]|nr:NfeD family protein [Planctomycetaceae bacterium]MDQ3329495.1 NfeD family protein [Planctomycetota bacterium]
MDYSHAAVLLLLISLALLVTEVFVPSGGFIAVLMLLALGGSVFCAFRAWWDTSPTFWWGYIACVLVLLPAVLIGAFTIFPRTPYGRRVLLDAPAPEEITPYVKEQLELQALIGRQGITVTPHSPGGMIRIESRRYHSETRGMMLDAGEAIEIVAVKGNRLVIRLADAPLKEDTTPPPTEVEEPSPPPTIAQADRPSVVDPFDPFLDEAEPK